MRETLPAHHGRVCCRLASARLQSAQAQLHVQCSDQVSKFLRVHTALQRTGGAGNLASSIQEILAEVDKDGDGRIDYQEFCDMMRGQACHPLFLPWRMSLLVPHTCLYDCKVAVLSAILLAGCVSRSALHIYIYIYIYIYPF